MQGGAYAARVIRRRVLGRPYEPFRYSDHGDVAVIGRLAGVTNIGWLGPFGRQGGFPAWALWLGIHIFYLIGFSNRIVVLLRWAWTLRDPWPRDTADHREGAAAADRGSGAAGPGADGAATPPATPPTTSRSSPAGSRRRSELGSVEDDDLAQAVAGAQSIEGGFQVVEPDAPVDQPLDRQPAGEMERGVAREVDRPDRRTRSSSRGSAGCRRRTGRPRTTPAPRPASSRRGRPSRRAAALSMASSTVVGRPIASKTKSGPPSVRSRSASIVAAGRRPRAGRRSRRGRGPRRAWPRPGRSPRSARRRRAPRP